MERATVLVLAIVLYKMASLGVSVCLSYMGYRLFMSGVCGAAGNIGTEHKGGRLTLVQAAPGTARLGVCLQITNF